MNEWNEARRKEKVPDDKQTGEQWLSHWQTQIASADSEYK